MENEKKHNMTVGDTVGIALTAYVGVKLFQAASSTVVSAVCFRRARKAAKAEAK